MPKDPRNSLHIYYKQKDKEIHQVLYPKTILGNKVNWRDFNYEMAYELYNQGWTEVCKYFKVETVEDLPYMVKWTWDTIPNPHVTEDYDKVSKTDLFKTYKELYIQAHIRECVGSMYSDAYYELNRACSNEYGNERTHRRKSPDEYKDYFNLNYLFYDMLGNQETNLEYNGAWVLKDGSYITVETAHHNRLLYEYLGYDEYIIERMWVKISMGTVHTHNRMTDAQKKTLNKFFKQYKLKEEVVED